MKPLGARRVALLLLLLFGAPLAAAFWLYYGSGWRPARTTNHGALIQPVVPLADATLPPLLEGTGAPAHPLRGRWSLVVVATGPDGCDALCRETLVYARQTWLSLGKLTPRVRRVLLAEPPCCEADLLLRTHAGLTALFADNAAGRALAAQFPAPHAGSIFIVDPLGNLMMRYDVRQDPKGLRLDLQKLLELSHIG
jgi:hypothetical protein